MKAKTMSRLNAELILMTEIMKAVRTASEAGLSEEDVKAVLNRIVEVIDSEE